MLRSLVYSILYTVYSMSKHNKPSTREQILDFIQSSNMTKPVDIYLHFEINRQMVHRHLKRLLEEGKIQKVGSAPKVYYARVERKESVTMPTFDAQTAQIIAQAFFFVEPTGMRLSGVEGFVSWCQKRQFDVAKKAGEFVAITQKYQRKKNNDLLDATYKIQKTFGNDCCVNSLFYFDFYAVEVFGKTQMGQKLLYAKQGQDKVQIKEIAALIKVPIIKLIERQHIDSVAFVPPTVPRTVQFMNILAAELRLSLASINIVKVIGDIRVPQKTLKKLEDRIENAKHTFAIDGSAQFDTTLLIDDAVGSGASINQIACKLKNAQYSRRVIGFAITGSLNDFEVISEV